MTPIYWALGSPNTSGLHIKINWTWLWNILPPPHPPPWPPQPPKKQQQQLKITQYQHVILETREVSWYIVVSHYSQKLRAQYVFDWDWLGWERERERFYWAPLRVFSFCSRWYHSAVKVHTHLALSQQCTLDCPRSYHLQVKARTGYLMLTDCSLLLLFALVYKRPKLCACDFYTAVQRHVQNHVYSFDLSSSSAFDVMVALTRSSLPWVPRTWMSGTDLLQTPRVWFWGTHKWAISAALLADGVSRTVGNVLVFGPPRHRGIERRSLCQSSWDGYSVCSGLFWGERWWSVGAMAADGVRPGLGCILQSCSGRWFSSYYG